MWIDDFVFVSKKVGRYLDSLNKVIMTFEELKFAFEKTREYSKL